MVRASATPARLALLHMSVAWHVIVPRALICPLPLAFLSPSSPLELRFVSQRPVYAVEGNPHQQSAWHIPPGEELEVIRFSFSAEHVGRLKVRLIPLPCARASLRGSFIWQVHLVWMLLRASHALPGRRARCVVVEAVTSVGCLGDRSLSSCKARSYPCILTWQPKMRWVLSGARGGAWKMGWEQDRCLGGGVDPPPPSEDCWGFHGVLRGRVSSWSGGNPG